MLYTVVGPTDMNVREALASLGSLHAAALVEDPDNGMGLVFLADPDPSETMTAIVEWADKNRFYYEVVLEEGTELPKLYANAEEVHHAKRVWDKLFRVTEGRVAPGEKSALLLLDDTVGEPEQENTTCYLANRCLNAGIPVLDLAHQMLSLAFEEPDFGEERAEIIEEFHEKLDALKAEPEEAPAQEPAEAPKVEDLVLTAEDLSDLTRDELKALCEARDVVPRDQRSKKSMAEALLAAQRSTGGEQQTPADQEYVVEFLEKELVPAVQESILVKEADPELQRILDEGDEEGEIDWSQEDDLERLQIEAGVSPTATEQAILEGPPFYFIQVVEISGVVRMYSIAPEVAESLIPS